MALCAHEKSHYLGTKNPTKVHIIGFFKNKSCFRLFLLSLKRLLFSNKWSLWWVWGRRGFTYPFYKVQYCLSNVFFWLPNNSWSASNVSRGVSAIGGESCSWDVSTVWLYSFLSPNCAPLSIVTILSSPSPFPFSQGGDYHGIPAVGQSI